MFRILCPDQSWIFCGAEESLNLIYHMKDLILFSVLDYMQALEEFEPRPKMHTALVNSVLRPRTHRKVCDSKLDAIVSQLEKFVKTQTNTP